MKKRIVPGNISVPRFSSDIDYFHLPAWLEDKARKKSYIIFLAGLLGVIFVLAMDLLYWHTPLFAEGRPNLSPGHLMRSIVILFSSVLMLASAINKEHLNGSFKVAGGRTEKAWIFIAVATAILFLGIFLLRPDIFNRASLEDGPVEWGSAILLFLSCGLFIMAFRKCLGMAKYLKWVCLLFAVVFFVMAMEEVSWFQRVFKIETPDLFAGNIQKEMNLHNFATNKVENIYYWGAFVFTVVLPFILVNYPGLKNKPVGLFVPRPFVAVIGAIACAYNYDMWNIVHIQLAFFGSICILIYFSVLSRNPLEKIALISISTLLIASQVAFLLDGKSFDRLWNVTEYKEFFIPLAFLAYSADVLMRFHTISIQRKTS